ncbi:MAG: family 16 glycosylhydrolase [Clostridia bacterium]
MAEIDILSINNKKIQDVEARKDIQVIKENNTAIKKDINNIKTDLGTKELTTTAKDVKGAINEVNTQYKENQINLIEDDTSIEGISDTVHDTLNTTNKTLIGAINEVNSQLEDVANLSLAIGRDGLLYIKKQDGTLIGTGVNVSSSGTDLSKVTMRVNGNTLILLNNGIQIASVDLPSSGGTTDVPNLIEKGVSETTYNALGTIDKTIIGGINEVRNNVQDIPTLFSTEQTDEYYKIKYNNIVIATIPLNSTSPNPPSVTKYTITNNLSHATNSNSTTSIEENSSYSATISANSNYRIKTVKVTMGGTDITNSVYSGGRISIPNVTGNIVITVTTEYVSSGEDLSKLEGILPNRLLVWHDEFDGQTLDTSKWRYATHNSGGSEQQAYTIGRTENVRLENNNLILEARKDGYVNNWTWSSGRIDTSGLAGFKYGRLEAKLKYDVVSGAFPAFWTIGTCAHYPTGENIHGVQKSKGTQWAQNGEIDMFEGRGTKSEIAQGGWYNQDDGKGNQTIIFGTSNIDASQYHVYAVEWTETTMISYIDGVETGRKDISNIASWHRPMYIILNMAVGSTGGYPADDCTSIKMEVDWVRVYAPVGVTTKEEVQSISLTQNNLSFNIGDDPIDVYYTVNPSTAWDNNVNYESNNTSVAEVYGSRIYPKGIGNCKITARATNGVTATINVTVAKNATINSTSITLNKDTMEMYAGASNTLTATVEPSNHTDTILWKTANSNIATVDNGVVTGVGAGTCNITAYSSANAQIKANCAVTVKEAKQLTGHPTNGLTLQLDRNGMSSTAWKNKIDNKSLPWKIAQNGKTDVSAYMVYDGEGYSWNGVNYLDHLTLGDFSNYYNFGESQTIILAGDFTNAVNAILSNKKSLSHTSNLVVLRGDNLSYSDANKTRLGQITKTFNINGCIALRYNKTTLRVDADTMPFTADTVTNSNTTLTSAFSQGAYPAVLGDISSAKSYYKLVLVYNRVLTNEEVQTAMSAIKTFLAN